MWSPADEGAAPVKIKDTFLAGLALLETAGGKKTIKGPNGEDSYNLFNVKDNSGKGFRAHDKAEGSNDAYRTYASHDAAKDDVTSLLARKYPGALDAETPEQFAAALKKGGYATDPQYETKLVAAIKNQPTAWDPASAGAVPVDEPAWNPASSGAIEVGAPPVSAKKEEPGWFEPGSKSAAIVNGFSQGATLGFGDEIGAGVNSVINGTKYKDELAGIRGSQATDQAAHPVLSSVSNFVGGAPAFLAGGAAASVGKAALGTAAVGAASGLGNAEGTIEQQARQAALGGIVGGVAGGTGKILSNAGNALRGAAKSAPPITDAQGLVNRLNPIPNGKFGSGALGTAIDHGLGGVAGYHGGDFVAPGTGKVIGAVYGATKGLTGMAKSGVASGVVAPMVRGAGKIAGVANAVVKSGPAHLAGNVGNVAYQQALVNMTKSAGKKAVAAGDAQVEQAVQSGQPAYAAKFNALQDPKYRQGLSMDDDEKEDEQDDEDE